MTTIVGIPLPQQAERGTLGGAVRAAGTGAVAGGALGYGLGRSVQGSGTPLLGASGLGALGGALSGGLTGTFGLPAGIASAIAAPTLSSALVLNRLGVNDIGIMVAVATAIPIFAGGIAGAIAGVASTDRR